MLLVYEKQGSRNIIYIHDSQTDFVYSVNLVESSTPFHTICQQIIAGERLDTLSASWIEQVETDFGSGLLADYDGGTSTVYILAEEMTVAQKTFFQGV